MRAPVKLLAEILLARINIIPSGTVHPNFPTLLEHTLLDGKMYFFAAIRDPAPLTDLRVRLDLSSASMLYLNLDAIREIDPPLIDTLKLNLTNSQDYVSEAVFKHLAIEKSHVSSKFYFRDVRAQLELDPIEVLVALHSYVNVFGGWDDAGDVAQQILDLMTSDSNLAGVHFDIVGTAALVLALRGSTGYEALFELLLANFSNPIELFFYGLRWASIEAKRKGDLKAAAVILERIEKIVTSELASFRSTSELKLIQGMSANFRGLLALRSGNPYDAEELSAQATRALNESLGSMTAPIPEERARYVWMAQLNRAQLAVLQGNEVLALARLREALEFARTYDPRAVHASLSTLAYIHLRSGQPLEARPLAEEALNLIRVEYDPRVALQVRKVLLRCYLELGLNSCADKLRSSGPYFWRDDSWPRSD